MHGELREAENSVLQLTKMAVGWTMSSIKEPEKPYGVEVMAGLHEELMK